MARWLGLLLAFALLVAGFAVGAAAVLVHGTWWGLPLGLVATATTLRALRPGALRMAFTLGWGVAVAVAAVPRGDGGYLVAGNVFGYAVMLAALAFVVAAAATLPPRRRRGLTRAHGGSHGLAGAAECVK